MTKTPRTDEVAETYSPSWHTRYENMKTLAEELEIELGKVLGNIPPEDEGDPYSDGMDELPEV